MTHFIRALSADIKIVRQLPKEYQFLTEDYRQKTKVSTGSPLSGFWAGSALHHETIEVQRC